MSVNESATILSETDEHRPSRGRPRDAEKNSAILDAAGGLFLENGFDGTSMDEVARRAGVSKQTVYSHFSSKEQLFSASIHHKIQAHYPDIVLGRLATHTLEADLMAVSEAYARLLLSPEAMAVNRILVAAAPKNTGLARIFWEAGPHEMMLKLSAFLKSWVEKGELKIDDTDEAANFLISQLKGKLHFLLSIGMIDTVSDADIDANVRRSVEFFLSVFRA